MTGIKAMSIEEVRTMNMWLRSALMGAAAREAQNAQDGRGRQSGRRGHRGPARAADPADGSDEDPEQVPARGLAAGEIVVDDSHRHFRRLRHHNLPAERN
jgi:hypothetical protein